MADPGFRAATEELEPAYRPAQSPSCGKALMPTEPAHRIRRILAEFDERGG
ncbi:MAG: hypothetical protein SWK90_10840 [Chloroflexota bacterium]|nr:hypothetical protein [Chloroflexota bacterium]